MGQHGGSGARQQPPERVCAVTGQAELLGDLAQAGLDPIAQASDRAAGGGWQTPPVSAAVGDHHLGAAGGLLTFLAILLALAAVLLAAGWHATRTRAV